MMKQPIGAWAVTLIVTVAAGCAAGTAGATTTTVPGKSGEPVVITEPSEKYEIRHRIVGTVAEIDRERGDVTVRTTDGRVQLRLPPVAASHVKKGVRASVEVSIAPSE